MKLFKIAPNGKENYFVTMREYADGRFQNMNLAVFPDGETADENKLLGFAKTTIDTETHAAYFEEMYIRPQCQGRKIGGELIKLRTAYAQNNGCDSVEVDFLTDSNLDRRAKFFAENGFDIVGAHGRKSIEPYAENSFPKSADMTDIEMDTQKIRDQEAEIYKLCVYRKVDNEKEI
jgi:GNAT superfamily N-acetyltransferase